MPWVSFDANTGKTIVESEQDVFCRAVACKKEFTEAFGDMSLHDRMNLLYLYYESARALDCSTTK